VEFVSDSFVCTTKIRIIKSNVQSVSSVVAVRSDRTVRGCVVLSGSDCDCAVLCFLLAVCWIVRIHTS